MVAGDGMEIGARNSMKCTQSGVRSGTESTVYLAFLHTPQICPQSADAPKTPYLRLPAAHLFLCALTEGLLSEYLLIVMICANAIWHWFLWKSWGFLWVCCGRRLLTFWNREHLSLGKETLHCRHIQSKWMLMCCPSPWPNSIGQLSSWQVSHQAAL